MNLREKIRRCEQRGEGKRGPFPAWPRSRPVLWARPSPPADALPVEKIARAAAHPLFRTHPNFEGGIRVPCLMRWPGKIPAGSSNDEITGIIDLLPTFCAIAGVDPPSDRVIDGHNIFPYLLGEEVDSPTHDSFVVPDVAIRLGDWKLLVKGQKPGGNGTKGMQGRIPAKAGSLFNLEDDLGETTDISAQHPEKVQELQKTFDASMKELRANTREIGVVDD